MARTDAKTRRNSTDLDDIFFTPNIFCMDAAHALLENAAELRKNLPSNKWWPQTGRRFFVRQRQGARTSRGVAKCRWKTVAYASMQRRARQIPWQAGTLTKPSSTCIANNTQKSIIKERRILRSFFFFTPFCALRKYEDNNGIKFKPRSRHAHDPLALCPKLRNTVWQLPAYFCGKY